MNFENTLEFAKELDEADPLIKFRDNFYIPILHGRESIYLCGNSLGLQPKNAQNLILNELEDWANYGKEARQFGRKPWIRYHEDFPKKLAPILGALPEEIVVMNQLTTNLHLLLTSFYRPEGQRFKILYGANTFPSDIYAVKSHIQMAGLNEKDTLVRVDVREGKHVLEEEDILNAIEKTGGSLALVLLDAVNYLTGQVLDIRSITAAAHAAGAVCGWDLAHAAGNIELQLHAWEVDFAVWCSYKYLNSGPGGIGGAFIHQQHHSNKDLPRLAGWWGNDPESRFEMREKFEPSANAESWQLSAPSILNLAARQAALDIFFQAGMKRIQEKSRLLSQWTFFILKDALGEDTESMRILTPQELGRYGSQVSIFIKNNASHLSDILRKNSVIADLLKGEIIRIAPVPLYNSYVEVFTLGQIIKNSWQKDRGR